ncbi:MAG TPA: flavin reductase [Spirochaetaceae bacterium]|nr:flavin reductase [Spirochaetaceae bacterium]
MDTKAFYRLTYGVFIVSVRSGDKVNACITNTCIQVASDPVRIALSCINASYTTELIKQSGRFIVSVLDKTAPFDLIKRFGMQSGRNVDKFKGIEFKTMRDGTPFVDSHSCALFECKAASSVDLGSHTLFIAEVTDAKVLGNEPPLTYAFYQSDVKPKTVNSPVGRKIKGWRCKICGYFYEGETLPADYLCPLCGHPAQDFEPVYE